MAAMAREVSFAVNLANEMNGCIRTFAGSTAIVPPLPRCLDHSNPSAFKISLSLLSTFLLAVEHSSAFNKRKRPTGDWYPAYVDSRLGAALKIIKDRLVDYASKIRWWLRNRMNQEFTDEEYRIARWFANNEWMLQIKYREDNPGASWYVSVHRELIEWAKDVVYLLYSEEERKLLVKSFAFWLVFKAKIGKVKDREKDYLTSYSALVHLALQEDPNLKEVIKLLREAVFKVKIAWREVLRRLSFKVPASWYRYLMYRPEPPRVRRRKAFVASLFWPGALLTAYAFKMMFRWMGVFYRLAKAYKDNGRFYGEKLAMFFPKEDRKAMLIHNDIYHFTHEMWSAFATLFGWGYGPFPLGGYARSRYPLSVARYWKSEFGPMKHLLAGVASHLEEAMEQFRETGKWPMEVRVRKHLTIQPGPTGVHIAVDMFIGRFLYDRTIGGDWKTLRRMGHTFIEVKRHEALKIIKCIRKLQYGSSFDCIVDALLDLAENDGQLIGFVMCPFLLDYPAGGTPVNVLEGTIPTDVALKFIEMVKRAAERDGSIEVLEKLVKRARRLRERLDEMLEEGKQTAGAMSNWVLGGGWREVIKFNMVGADRGAYWKYLPGRDGKRVDSEEGVEEMAEKWTEIMDWFYAILVYMKMKALSRLSEERRKELLELMQEVGIITNTGVWSSPFTAAPRGAFRYSRAKYELTDEWRKTYGEALRRGVIDSINWFFRKFKLWFE